MRLALTLLAMAVLTVAAPARATTTHWYYAVPGSCGVQHDGPSGSGVVDITTGQVDSNAWGNTDNIIITCQLRLPQGATVTRARVWGDDPRSGGYSLQFSIKTINYASVGTNIGTALSGHSATGSSTYWWNQYQNDTLLIDNENNSYAFDIYMTGGVFAVTRLVELTYTMP